jgi:hypothetical protein
MINDLLLIIFFSCLSAGLSMMLDYGLGKPGSIDPEDIGVSEFLSWWTFALARRRLIVNDMFDEIENVFIIPKNDPYRKVFIIREFKRTVIEKGREFWTWEKIVGGCPICTGFWVALIIAILVYFVIPLHEIPSWFYFITTPAFSHFLLRRL